VIDKRVHDFGSALAGIRDGDTVLCAGFGAVGAPHELLEALIDQGARDLVIVSNNAGDGPGGLSALIAAGRVRKIICSYPRSADPRAFQAAYRSGKLELELVPQGTLSERMRCAAAGLGGYFSRVAAGTRLGANKETRLIDGKLFVFEGPLPGDAALIRAHQADRWGNLVFRKSARNFNPVMAMAAKLAIAHVTQFVELGDIDPDQVHTPGIFVDRVVQVPAQC
jgi:3-oxoadipate CoA-transferase, alpha subunit